MIREAKPHDFDRVIELYAQLNPEDRFLEDGGERAVFDAIQSAPHLYLLVLEDDGGVVQATCYLNIIPNISRQASSYAIIENVITEETRRNQGLGRQIIAHALRVAWDHGCYKVMLQTGSRLESTHNFYKACGFSDSEKFAFVARP